MTHLTNDGFHLLLRVENGSSTISPLVFNMHEAQIICSLGYKQSGTNLLELASKHHPALNWFQLGDRRWSVHLADFEFVLEQQLLPESSFAYLREVVVEYPITQIALQPQIGSSEIPQSKDLVLAAMDIAEVVGNSTDARMIAWHPSRLWSPFDIFLSSMRTLRGGGPAPILQLVQMMDNEDTSISTLGLEIFCGQEITADFGEIEKADAIKVIARVADDLIQNGPIREEIESFADFANLSVEIRPSTINRKILELKLM